jgi:hypothetical protein
MLCHKSSSTIRFNTQKLCGLFHDPRWTRIGGKIPNYVTFDWHHVVGGNTLPMARTKPSLYKEEEVVKEDEEGNEEVLSSWATIGKMAFRLVELVIEPVSTVLLL